MVKQLDHNTLEQIAEMICGTDGAGPKYRSAWDLEKFFMKGVGWPDVPACVGRPGYGRFHWTRDLLDERSGDPEAIAQVIRRLADLREYSSDTGQASAAIDQLNGILASEGIQVDYLHGSPQLVDVPVQFGRPSKAPLELQAALADLVREPALAQLLQRRLDEVQVCRDHGAHVCAVIMLGSVLEGVLVDVARANMTAACTAVPPPRDREGKQFPPEEWKLTHLINVALKCRWIKLDVARFSHELREYRNMVHPNVELKDEDPPTGGTVTICWDVVVEALNQLASKTNLGAPIA